MWFAALLLGSVASRSIGSDYSTGMRLPGVESRQGLDLLEDAFAGKISGNSATIVFSADAGVTDPTVQATMEDYFARIETETGVEVVSPYSPAGLGQTATSGATPCRAAPSSTRNARMRLPPAVA